MQRVCIHIPTILAILPHKSLSMLGRFLIYQNLPKDVEENERSICRPHTHVTLLLLLLTVFDFNNFDLDLKNV